jgi:hypothetical protein
MLKLSLVALFVTSLATLSFASSLMPAPVNPEQPVWIQTYE